MPKMYTLPNGEVTTDHRKYVSSYVGAGKKIAKALGGKFYAFDPGYQIKFDSSGDFLSITAEVGGRLVELIDSCDQLKKENFGLKRRLDSKKK